MRDTLLKGSKEDISRKEKKTVEVCRYGAI